MAKVAVVGIGYVGLPLCTEMAKAGFFTTGYDMSETKVASLLAGKSYIKDVPDELIVNATAPDASVMGVRHRELPIHGVQFHPESIATEHGHAMLANFLKIAGIESKALA